MLTKDKDPLGQAILDFHSTGLSNNISVVSDIAEEDVIPTEYLFRNYSQMPPLEKFALDKCKGNILDVGAAAGSHSLVLQEQKKTITALEISELCCTVMQQRGVKNVINADFYKYSGTTYDTILLLMNGIGIAGNISGLEIFFKQVDRLLNNNGCVIFDSSDVDYLYEEEDGSKWINLNCQYYGELHYQMTFKKISGENFPWLFIDYDTLAEQAVKYGFEAHLLAKGDHFDYLGMLVRSKV